MKTSRMVQQGLALLVSASLALSPLSALAGGPPQPRGVSRLAAPIDQGPSQPAAPAQPPSFTTSVEVSANAPLDSGLKSLLNPGLKASRSPKLDTSLARIAESAAISSLGAVAAAVAAAQAVDAQTLGSNALVEIVPATPDSGALQAAITAAGGQVTGVSRLQPLIQAWLPVTAIASFAARPDVAYIRTPAEAIPLEDSAIAAFTSEGVGIAGADTWHTEGYRGAGVKVGIIDGGFISYTELLGTEISATVVVSNFVAGETNVQVNGSTKHGTACAEIAADMAPDAQLYLAKINTSLDLEKAVNWLISQHVDVISMSLAFGDAGPGDGTGYLANIIDGAKAAGITWATAGGNFRRQHWGGTFSDTDGDKNLNFSGTQNVDYFGPGDGSAYLVAPGAVLRVTLRWDDWTAVNQDYDLYAYRYNGSSWVQIASSQNFQTGQGGQRPVESVTFVTNGGPAPYGFAVQQFNATRAVNLELTAFDAPLDEFVPARSLAQPADVQAAISVAAVNAADPYPQEGYSSEGPANGPGGTPDGGKAKPDIAGYANVSTAGYGPTGFNGTSAATPHVAGAAALVLGAFPAYTPDQVRAFLQGRAADLGPQGSDTAFGAGRLVLGEPPAKLPLTVNKTGGGSGGVTSSPGGIDCGATCSATFVQTTPVTLTATAAADSSFGGWSGACTGTGVCAVTIDAATTITATFIRSTAPLTVGKAGDGSGTVTSTPEGIDCGTACTATYSQTTPVTLTATAATGSSFAGWSGACTGNDLCAVTIDAARAVTATFTRNPVPLTVTPAGGLRVVSVPAGIDCGITCTATFPYGTEVALDVVSGAEDGTIVWAGDCTELQTCQVTMDQARTVELSLVKPQSRTLYLPAIVSIQP